jgi:hypothetical protein
LAENVEFFYSTLGERRYGSQVLSTLPVGITGDANFDAVTWLFNHVPANDFTAPELWVFTVSTGGSGSVGRLFRFQLASSTWSEITVSDAATFTASNGYRVYGQSLHGKLYIAYKNAVDRLHVWDGAVFRRVGLASHAAPTAADTNVAGAYPATLRYYRTRLVKRSGGVVQLRSEPSPSVSITPNGGFTGIVVTRAALPGDSETDWEIEASTDNVIFYRLSTVAAATTTYTDTALVATYANNTQSDPVGSYTLIPSIRYLSSDGDRLLLGGSWVTTADGSAVRWTPVGNDPLPGPDERLDATTSPRLDLDSQEGGDITAMTRVIAGTLYVFKLGATYKLLRTGQLVGAYEGVCLTKARGALPRSVIEASDEAGRPAHYFLDPGVGPMRAGSAGMQYVGHGVRNLWKAVNIYGALPCHGVFYTDKQQVHWWVAQTSGGIAIAPTTPNAKIILQVNEITLDEQGGARRSWTTVPLVDASTADSLGVARCSVMFPFNEAASAQPILRLLPLIGKGRMVADIGDTSIQYCDVNTVTTDNGVAYTARVRTRPFFLTNILNRHGIMAGALLGTADSEVLVKAIRDFGVETLSIAADMSTAGAETFVIAHLDNLNFAELFALQIEFADDPDNLTQWRLLQLALKTTEEQTA